MQYTCLKKDSSSKARLGVVETAHGSIETPVFMPVGTRASVKTLTNQQLIDVDAKIILGNTYHLMLKPGMDIIKKAGGLHRFMNWERALLTDSGRFQVFSLSALNKITDGGVQFQSHIDGKKCFLGPLESMDIQKTLGSDIVMAFDQCAPYPCEKKDVIAALERTDKWAKICRNYELQSHQALFGIIQGGVYPDLRLQSATSLRSMNFDGYAIGGLSVGEPAEIMYDVIDHTEPHMPQEKPRYLMGVGTPRNIIEAVMRGIDMFDCVMPTRNAQWNGFYLVWKNSNKGRSLC